MFRDTRRAKLTTGNSSLSNSQEKAATTIQKHVRRFLARRKYSIQHLREDQQESYLTFVVGNDPWMPPSLDKYNEPNKKVALIATSGMRAVSLACKLGNKKNIPKIVVIDNSSKVYKFWYEMREFIKYDKNAATAELFLKNLPSFLSSHKNLYRDLQDKCVFSDAPPGIKYLNQNINIYFNELIEEYGYDYVRAVILHDSLIKQSWADENVFVKVKNILAYQGIDTIYMYPSNMVACIQDPEIRDQVLENIANANPVLSIYTDYCQIHRRPENVYLLENNYPDQVANTIFAPGKCASNYPSKISLADLEFLFSPLQSKNSSEFDNNYNNNKNNNP